MIPCIGLCASHIDNEVRLELLKCSIDSMLNQSKRIPLWISISTPWDSLDISIEYPPYVHIFIHTKKQFSQFEHFYFLIEQIKKFEGEENHPPINLDKTFCIFFDDDDYSYPERIHFYSSADDTGQHSLLATDSILLMREPTDVSFHTLETCKGEPSTNGHEYFMYALRASKLEDFCNIMLKYNCIHYPICDILLSSVLFSSNFMNRSCKPLSWLYAYSVRDEIKKDRGKEMMDYFDFIQIPGLLADLEKEFQIDWYEGYPGYISIYGNDEFIKYSPLPRHGKIKRFFNKIKKGIRKLIIHQSSGIWNSLEIYDYCLLIFLVLFILFVLFCKIPRTWSGGGFAPAPPNFSNFLVRPASPPSHVL